MLAKTMKTFSSWLRTVDQSQFDRDACIKRLRIYLIRICTDIFFFESNGPKSSSIWMILNNWNYLTYSLRVPSPDYLNLGDVLDLADFTNFETSRADALSLFPNDLDDIQRRYINDTISIIRDRQ